MWQGCASVPVIGAHVAVVITDAARRALLVRRHRLDASAGDADVVVGDLVAMHATDPTTPRLATSARAAGTDGSDVEVALVDRRSLWRLHAMRRTMFLVPAADAAMFHAAVGRDVAARERARLLEWLTADMSESGARRLLARVEQRLVDVMGADEWRTRDLAQAVPDLDRRITVGSGRWSSKASLASRLLLVLAAELVVVRTRPVGTWRSGHHHWALATSWFDALPPVVEDAAGASELARRYVARFGPVTVDDVRWWAGWTATRARRALATLDLVTVALEDGREAFVSADDLDEIRDLAGGSGPRQEGRGVCLLPALDPTPMGHRHRQWYVGDLTPEVFDTIGNVGPTVWADGRIVGAWAQLPDGTVVTELLVPLGATARSLVAARAEELSGVLDGEVVVPRFRTPVERRLSDADDA